MKEQEPRRERGTPSHARAIFRRFLAAGIVLGGALDAGLYAYKDKLYEALYPQPVATATPIPETPDAKLCEPGVEHHAAFTKADEDEKWTYYGWDETGDGNPDYLLVLPKQDGYPIWFLADCQGDSIEGPTGGPEDLKVVLWPEQPPMGVGKGGQEADR